jgi:hypothetical protein
MEIAKVLDDWDPVARSAVCIGRAPRGIIDIQRVDSDQHGTSFLEVKRSRSRQERMRLEVLVGCPMFRPSGLHENCFAPHINRNKGLSINSPARHAFGAHDHGLQLRKT